MAETKWGKYFITDSPPNPKHPESRQKNNNMPWENTIYINEELNGTIKNAFYLETNMVLRTTKGDIQGKPHSHDFDEYLVFLGTDPDDQFDLRGEVEFWIEDEKHIITKSCAVFVPGNVPHCPLVIRRVDRPFMFVTTGNSLGYKHMGDR
ncbi:cupin domain-containing protein [Chloroflexota bacterium]